VSIFNGSLSEVAAGNNQCSGTLGGLDAEKVARTEEVPELVAALSVERCFRPRQKPPLMLRGFTDAEKLRSSFVWVELAFSLCVRTGVSHWRWSTTVKNPAP
jgi:hypothetical protein